MDLDVEIMQVQEKIYCAEKEVTLLELELQRKVQCLVDLQRRELSLLERKQRPTPATEGLGGLLVTAVWAGDDLVDCAKSDVGEDGEVTVQTSTQDLGHETEVKFSQPLSDISDPRVKVSRVEAVELLRDKTMSTREAAEMLMRKVLKVDFVDLSSDDLQEVEDSVAKIGKRMLNLNRSVKKSHNVARPDDTFLSSSMYDDLRLKVQAKMTVAEEEDSGEDRTGEVLVGEGVREDKVGDEVEEAGLDGGLLSSGKQGGRGYYKAFFHRSCSSLKRHEKKSSSTPCLPLGVVRVEPLQQAGSSGIPAPLTFLQRGQGPCSFGSSALNTRQGGNSGGRSSSFGCTLVG